MRRSRTSAILYALALTFTLIVPTPALLGVTPARAQDTTPEAIGSTGSPVILFAAPGMAPEAIDALAAEGVLPALSGLLDGAQGSFLAPFPAGTSTMLPTLLSGTWPAEHGIVGETFYRTGSPDFADTATWSDPGLIQADTLPQAAERAGKSVVAIGWDGAAGLDPALAGPVVGEAMPFSQAGLLTSSELGEQAAMAAARGVAYEAIALEPAEGWSAAPESYSPAQEAELTVRSLDANGANPNRTFAIYIYDSTDDAATNYDRVLVAPDKLAADEGVELSEGAWASLPVELNGDRESETAGFWLKAITLTPDLSDFGLYYTPISRYRATWLDCGERPECAQPGGFEEYLNEAVGPALAIDASSLAAGLIDAATFMAQGTTSAEQSADALRLIVEELGVQPDLLLLESSFPEAVSRQFPALSSENESGGATPVSAGSSDSLMDAEAFTREAYAAADRLLAAGRELLGPEVTTLAVASRAFEASTQVVNAGQLLVDAGLAAVHPPGQGGRGGLPPPPATPDPEALPVGPAVKACWSGGTAHIYLNLDGREAAGSVPEDAYVAAGDAIVAAFADLEDPANPDATVVAGIYRKEELRDVGGVDALHPSRSGDVVVTLAPPYRFGDLEPGVRLGPASTVGSGGYLAPADSGLLLADGPAIADGATHDARAIDVAPTAAFLLGVPGPYNASGEILLDALTAGPVLRAVTLLDISDFHGQLPPLTARADDIAADGAVNSSYDVGGVAVLGPWFHRYREQANGDVLLVTAGDAVGATPPISNAFCDLPTIEVMNALGFTADALGNHNFDAGADYMFGALAPVAEFPYLSANLVLGRPDLATPGVGAAPFQPSLLLELGGVSVGLVGFSNPDIPRLTRPGALDPYRVIDPVQPVNEEAARLREQGADVVIAMGHMGATGGTLTEPTGPVVDLADQLEGVDVVVGDHTDVQVAAIRPNGVLLVENRSKGVMFTRVTLVVDSESGELVYGAADYHRPWVIGVTPDPEMVERLDALEAELAPTLGRVIGSAAQPILRSDSCGMETGRTCESLVGNVITDAMRTTYGVDFAITNSGGIRAELTCPADSGEFCPTDDRPNQITEGQVLTVLPFGNVAVTLDVTGAELKAMLEAGISFMPEPSGAFPQVSGFCFTYDLEAEPGSRVTAAVRQAADGSCSGEAIDFSDASTYTLATNDFTASGGDGYPDLLSRANSRDVLASVVASYIAAESPLTLPGAPLDPAIEGRITCAGEGCPSPVGD